MSTYEPFDVEKIVSLWTTLLKLQIDIGYYPDDDSISFPPKEGRAVDEELCQELHLTEKVISLLKHLPCPKSFDEAYDTPIFYESMAVPFIDNEWIRNSRDPERCMSADDVDPLRTDFLEPEELALVLMKDDPGYHLILDTKANTARFFIAMDPPYDSGDEEEDKVERPDYRMHYRNHPARPAVAVLEEVVAKFRDLIWISVRDDGGWPQILSADSGQPNAYASARKVLQEQFGWPDNFDRARWNRERTEIWSRVLAED